MRVRDPFGVYHVLETRLRASVVPLTCVDLFDDPEVKQFASTVARVSDYLGHMFRRGLLRRVPAPKSINSQARWAYSWKDHSSSKYPPNVHAMHPQGAEMTRVLDKPSITVSNDGKRVVIELLHLSITLHSHD